MKKIFFLAAALSLFVGCQKSAVEEPTQDESVNCNAPEVLYASIDGEQNTEGRTYFDGAQILWQSGDEISYLSSADDSEKTFLAKYAISEGAETTTATFECESIITEYISDFSKTYAIYPYAGFGDDPIYEDNKLYTSFPSTQSYAVNSFGQGANKMIAVSNERCDPNLYFRNLCGFLVIKLYGEGVSVKNIKLSSHNTENKLAGSTHITFSPDAAPEIVMQESATSVVTLDCSNGGEGVALGADAENATEFWFALPPVTFDQGFNILVTDTNNRTFVKETTKQVTIARNKVQPMAALEYSENTPGDNRLWYTRPSGETTPVDFGGSVPFDANIISHTYQASTGRFVIEFDNPLTTITDEAFYETDITSITLPESLEYILQNAFARTSITSVTIPGSVIFIGVDAFYKCEQLTSITFEESPQNKVLDIGYGLSSMNAVIGPFYYSPLRTINLYRQMNYEDDAGDAYTATEWDEGIFAYDFWNTYDAEEAEHNWTTSLNIGSQVTAIHDFMFSGVRLTKFWIPQEVKSIGYKAFHDCRHLVGVTLGHTTPPTLGEKAFSSCDPLSYIAIKVGTKSLYEAADNWKDLLDEYDHIDPLFRETVN